MCLLKHVVKNVIQGREISDPFLYLILLHKYDEFLSRLDLICLRSLELSLLKFSPKHLTGLANSFTLLGYRPSDEWMEV